MGIIKASFAGLLAPAAILMLQKTCRTWHPSTQNS